MKEIGGISVKTKNVDASERWEIIHHHMVAMQVHLNENVRKNTKNVNIELGALKTERYEKDVQMILTCLKNWTPNMWYLEQDTKYAVFRSTNQQYCNRKNSQRGDEQKHIKSQERKEDSKQFSQFIGRFTLPKDITKEKSYNNPSKSRQ